MLAPGLWQSCAGKVSFFHLPLPAIDQKGDLGESEKGNADRQGDWQDRKGAETEQAKQGIAVGEDEIPILEDRDQQQIGGDGEGKCAPSGSL
jgi:hypothetical protein